MESSNSQKLSAWLSQLSLNNFTYDSLELAAVDETNSWEIGQIFAEWYTLKSESEFKQKHVALFLYGTLGCGKTYFCQSFISALCKLDSHFIESPTYAYVIPYTLTPNATKIFHFDLYRLQTPQQVQALSLDECWHQPGLSLIEWPQCVQTLAPWPRLELHITYETMDKRHWRWAWKPMPVKGEL